MPRINRNGFYGEFLRRRVDGSLTGTSRPVFIHINRIIVNFDSELVRLRFGIWDSKSDYVTGKAEIDLLGSTQKEYFISKQKIKKGRDVYTANGTDNSFAFTKANDGEEFILVKIGNDTQIIGVDYTVRYDSGSSGIGQVVFTTTPEEESIIKLIRLIPAWDYFKPKITTKEGKDHYTQAVEILRLIDGTDEWDNIGIDFTSLTEDTDS